MKSLFGSFLVLAIAWPAFSQQPMPAQEWTPTLFVPRDGKTEPLDLARLVIEVRIVGCVAETSVTMTFANPLPRAAEGDLLFPLPDDATVSGYALDVQGRMVDGVSVEKRHASDVSRRRKVGASIPAWSSGTGGTASARGFSYSGPGLADRARAIRQRTGRWTGRPLLSFAAPRKSARS